MKSESAQTSNFSLFTSRHTLRAMTFTARRPLIAACLSLSILAISSATFAAADDKDAEVKKKEAEIQRLKKELEQAQKEIKQLKKEVKDSDANARATASTPAKPLPPLRPIATLPPLAPDQVVSAVDLARYFKEDFSSATSRFDNRTIRVRGTIDSFEPKMLMRLYSVNLDSNDRTAVVTCSFHYEDRFKAVYPIEDGQTLLGRIDDRASVRLMKAGQEVTIEGKCEALKGRRITLSGCKVVGN